MSKHDVFSECGLIKTILSLRLNRIFKQLHFKVNLSWLKAAYFPLDCKPLEGSGHGAAWGPSEHPLWCLREMAVEPRSELMS